MTGYVRWSDIRADHVARAGGEDAVEAGKQELLAVVTGHRLAEVRRARYRDLAVPGRGQDRELASEAVLLQEAQP